MLRPIVSDVRVSPSSLTRKPLSLSLSLISDVCASLSLVHGVSTFSDESQARTEDLSLCVLMILDHVDVLSNGHAMLKFKSLPEEKC
ncbi:hypothetical protein RJT34_17152 [Clitoria ternatea]|uniref:Uncharacterized protein n=1 Tax=Clitoria ternatea TaxID=43366 RepID=A0AAN9J8F3_CLITE